MKAASAVLAVALFLSSFANHSFAQETTETTDISSDTAEISAQDVEVLAEPIDIGSSEVSAFNAAPVSGGGGDGVTPSDETTNVSSYGGDFSYQFPIRLPEGTNGFTPQLTLSYSSADNSQHSLLGIYGWSIAVPHISLYNKTGIENLYSDPTYYSSLSGELVKVGPGEYQAKYQSQPFLRYFKIIDTWEIETAEGVRMTLGSTVGSQIVDPADSSKVYRWSLDEVEDKNGNTIAYQYYKDSNALYLDTIRYGEYGAGSTLYEVEFLRTAKNATSTTYEPTFPVTQTKAVHTININVGGVTEYHYDLTLTAAANPNHVLLSTIEEVGANGESRTTSFVYESADLTFSANMDTDGTNGYWDIGDVSAGGDKYFYERNVGNKWRIADVNGDGQLDIIGPNQVWLNNGKTFTRSTAWENTQPNFQFDDTLSLRYIDINGDQLADIVYSTDEAYHTGFYKSVYLNTGSGWVYDTTYTNSVPDNFAWVDTASADEVRDHGWRIVDINDDGLRDLIHDDDDGAGGAGTVYLNDGTQWVLSTDFTLPDAAGFALPQALGYLVDVNGDDLVDLVSSYDNGTVYKNVFINTGTTWVTDATFANSIPGAFAENAGSFYDLNKRGYELADINNDGLVDILYDRRSDTNTVAYLNLGDRWSSTSVSIPNTFGVIYTEGGGVHTDINGDTLVDVLYAQENDGEAILLSTSGYPDRLATITEAAGGEIDIQYKGSAETDAGVSVNPALPFSLLVTESVTYTDDSFVSTEQFEYADGHYYYQADDIRDRRFSGFGKVTKTTELGKEITYHHQGNAVDVASEEGIDGEALIGRVYRTDITDLNNNLYQVKRYNYATTSVSSSSPIAMGGMAPFFALTPAVETTPAQTVAQSEWRVGFARQSVLPTPASTVTTSTRSVTTPALGSRFVQSGIDNPVAALKRLNLLEQATAKGELLAKATKLGKRTIGDLELQLVSVAPTDGGVEVFARAWQDREQIGFGVDGSVDLERFRVFNPPVLVDDINGDIVLEWDELDPETNELVTYQRTLRYDPEAALLQTLGITIPTLKNVAGEKNIVAGKRGNTTSIFYASELGSGMVSISSPTWADARAGLNPIGGSIYAYNTALQVKAGQAATARYDIIRGHLSFDTSALTDVEIQSARVSIHQFVRSFPYNTFSANITNSTKADPLDIAPGDFTSVEDVRFSTDLSVPNENAWRDFDLNSAGLAEINQSGHTQYAFRAVGDIDNTVYAIGNTSFYPAVHTGTAYDPKLVVEHVSPLTIATDLEVEGQINPVDITDSTPEFSAIFNDPDAGDTASDYQIQVATTSDFASIHWDSGKTAFTASTSVGVRTPDISYTGATLASSTNYYWRMKFWDQADNEGAWSTSTATFSLYDPLLSGISTFIKLESELTLDFDGDADERAAATSYTYDDSHGSILTQTEWGEVAGNTDGTFSDVGSDRRQTTYEYATNTDGLVLPSKQTLIDQSTTTVAETRFYYDNQALGTVSTGNLTKQEDWVTGSTYVDREWTHDSRGLVLSETDPRDNVTIYEYDTYDLYVSSTTNPAGHNTQYEYDYASGQLATTTDPSGRVYVTTYDAFGRPLADYAPDPQTGNQVVVTEYQYTDTAGAVSIKQINHLSSTLSQDSYSYLDGFGRIIQERVQAENNNEYAVRDFAYGDNGLLEKESLPYFNTGAARDSGTINTDLFTTYVYGPLERVNAAETSVGTTYHSYDQWTETITDPAGNDKDLIYDALGRLATVTEYEGTNTYHTNYQYDVLDNINKFTNAEGDILTGEHDALSRLILANNWRDPSDSYYGTWLFAYDEAGNLSSTTDPNGNVVNYTHDNINRILTEDYLGAAGTEVTYTYDTCTIGQLCIAAKAATTTSYTYTPNSLVASEAKLIDSTTYTTSYEYDRQGNPTRMTYPDNSEVQYTYNSAGRIETISQRPSGGGLAAIINEVNYGPHGQITYLEHANGMATNRSYDNAALYRLLSLETSYGGAGGAMVAFPSMPLSSTTNALPENLELTEPELPVLAVSTSTDPTEPVEVETDTETIATSSAEQVIETSTTTELIASSTPPQPTSTPPATNPSSTSTATITEPETASTTTQYTDEAATTTNATTSEPTETVTATTTITKPVATTSTSTLTETARSQLPVLKERTGAIFTELRNKSAKEKATLKAARTLAAIKTERTTLREFDTEVEIIDANPIDGGYEVFVRAWNKDGQIGFGPDGSVDIERFRVFNPPVLVPDRNGAIETLGAFNERTNTYEIDRYTYDPYAALLEVLGHTIAVKHEKFPERYIEPGTVGNTTSIFYPDADPETNSFDGYVAYRDAYSGKHAAGWAAVRTATTAIWAVDDATGFAEVGVTVAGTNNGWQFTRGIVGFDTSSLGDDVISNATLSLYFNGAYLNHDNDGNDFISIAHPNPASDTALAVDDYSSFAGLTGAMSEGVAAADRIDIGTLVSGGQQYYDWSLNSTGIGWIDGHNTSFLGIVLGHDLLADPVSSNLGGGQGNRADFYAADQTGTTNAPVLVIEHSASGGSGTPSSPGIIQSLNYTYDTIGNITQIVDISTTTAGAAATTTYTYDDLYRLLSASTTGAVTNPYSRTYTYNSIGNILTKSDVGSYSYDGDIGTSYANVHAATEIGGISHTYDNNGNLIAAGSDTYGWTYRNELASSTVNGITTQYAYDATGSRIKKHTSSTTTYYPFPHYEVKDGVASKNIYLGEMLVATIEDGDTFHNHLDHLGSTNVVTNASGTVAQVLSYYPYGDTRIDNQFGSLNQTNRYTGHDFDSETDLNYMKARYQNGQHARFLSIDPYMLDGIERLITDPQLMNTYGYARNNPLIYNDPTGEVPVLIPLAVGAFAAAYYSSDTVSGNVNAGVNSTLAAASGHTSMDAYNQSVASMSNSNTGWEFAMDHPNVTGIAVGIGSVPAVAGGHAALTNGVLAKGISLTTAAQRLAGSATYGYLAQDQLTDTIPSVVSAMGDMKANGVNANNAGSFVWGVGTSFVPGALKGLGQTGENASAMLEITDAAISVTERSVRDDDNKDRD